MKRRRQTRSLPPVYGRCELDAGSVDAERRAVEVIFLSGAPIARHPLWEDSFWLEFDLTAKAADFGRVRAGNVPVLDSHQSLGVGGVLGKVESARIEAGQARALLRFSKRAEVDPVWQDIQDGILTGVSGGFVLHEVEEAEKRKGDDMRRFIAKRWELMEVSIVGVPADGGARIEASAEERHACRLTLFDDGGNDMRKKTRCPACREKLTHEGDEELKECQRCGADFEEFEQEQAELARAGRIHRLASHFAVGELWARRHVELGTSAKEAEADGRRLRAERAPEVPDGRLTCGMDYDSPAARGDQMADALAARATGKEPKEGRRFHGWSIAQLAGETLRRAGRTGSLGPATSGGVIIREALAHVTSDFPQILGGTVNRILLPIYENATPAYRQIAQRRDFRDFRVHTFARAGDFPTPLVVGEGGEITEGSLGERAETGFALTYARIFSITRQALVNDDLGAFADLAMKAATRALDLENATFFSRMITTGSGLGPTLSDGAALFNSAHANVASAGALDVAHLGEARQLLLNQTSIDGLKLNIPAAILLVPPASQTLGEQLVAPLQPQQVSNVNPFQGRLVVLTDANLPTPGTRYYVLGDPVAGRSSYVYGNVQGEVSPFVQAESDFDTDGLRVKLRLDFGAAAVDFRFGVTGAGA